MTGNEITLSGYTVSGQLLSPTVATHSIGVASNAQTEPSAVRKVPALHRAILNVFPDALLWLPVDMAELRRGLPASFRDARPGCDADNTLYGCFVNCQLAYLMYRKLAATEANVSHEYPMPDERTRADVFIESAGDAPNNAVVIETDNARDTDDQIQKKFNDRSVCMQERYLPYQFLYVTLIYGTTPDLVARIPAVASAWVDRVRQLLVGRHQQCLVLQLNSTNRARTSRLTYRTVSGIGCQNKLLLPEQLPFSVFDACMTLYHEDYVVAARRLAGQPTRCIACGSEIKPT